MLQLRVFFVANVAFTRFFCRKYRDYALFGVEFWQKFWRKFLEILRILTEILRKKLACGASAPYPLFNFISETKHILCSRRRGAANPDAACTGARLWWLPWQVWSSTKATMIQVTQSGMSVRKQSLRFSSTTMEPSVQSPRTQTLLLSHQRLRRYQKIKKYRKNIQCKILQRRRPKLYL